MYTEVQLKATSTEGNSVTKMTSGFANVHGRQLYYQTQGEGAPLIMLHAGIADLRMWDEQWEELSQSFQVIRYDRPGFGQSPAVQGAVPNREDLAGLMNCLGINRAHLLGCSMGGELALDFALAFPDRVCSLTLISATPSGFELQGAPPAGIFDLFAAMQTGDLERANALQIQISFDGPHRQPDQVDPLLRRRFLEMHMTALRNGGAMATDAQPLDPPAVTRLAEVVASTLLIVGGLDHPEILRAASVMANGIPNVRQAQVPNAGHFLNVEQAEAANRLILEFLTDRPVGTH